MTYKHISLLILCFSYVSVLFGQQKNYTLSTNESGAPKTYVARDFVSMKPGFSFSASGGNTFNAKIDEKLIFPPTANVYAYSDGTITTDPTMGGVVGSIPGQFNVSQTGAASYTIPIECPPGINGVQPNIALSYNSLGGDGPLGIGWTIGGISSITCIPENSFRNGKVSGLDFTKVAGQYAIDGNALFGSLSAYGTAGCEYFTETKTYQKIFSYGSVTIQGTHVAPEYFVVTTKDGTVIEYRHRAYLGNNTNYAPYQWLISKMTDANGNYMTFAYTNGGRYQTVLSQIDYSGNTSGTATFARMAFNYGTKSPVKSSILAGSPVEDALYLTSIVISNTTTSTEVKRYDCNYNIVKEHYYLKSLTLKGVNGIKYNPTIFDWGPDVVNSNIQTCTVAGITAPATEVMARHFSSGDIDGDGFSDIIQYYKRKEPNPDGTISYINRINVRRSGLEGIGTDLIMESIVPHDVQGEGLSTVNGGLLIGEFNGDRGKSILVPSLVNDNGYSVFFHDVRTGLRQFNYKLSSGSEMPKYTIGDINNDGIDEIITVENGSSQICRILYLKKGDYSQELAVSDKVVTESFTIGAGNHISDIFVSDFDMDGLKDIMFVTESNSVIYKNKGATFETINSNLILSCQFEQGITTNCFKSDYSCIRPGDFNGDGLLDFLVNEHCNAVWKLVNNTGSGFVSSVISNMNAIEESYTAKNDTKDECFVLDYDRDGKSDVIMVDVKYHTNGDYDYSTIKWYKSNGTSFDLVKDMTINDEDYFFRVNAAVGDYNGDGNAELFSFDSNLYTGNDNSDLGRIYYYSTNHDANKITTITDGLAKSVSINYQLLSYSKNRFDSKDFYTIGAGSVYPYIDVLAPISSVCRTSQSNSNSVNSYEYSGLKAHVFRGLLGISTNSITNALNISKMVYSTFFDPNNGYPSKTLVQKYELSSDYTVSSTENIIYPEVTENAISTDSYRKVVEFIPIKTVESDILTSLTKTTDSFVFDSYGNMTSCKTTIGDLVENKTIIYGQYGSFCPNKPTSVTTSKHLGSDVDTRVISYLYDTKGNLTKEIVDPVSVNSVTTEYKNFDVFGHATTVVVTANGMTRSSSSSFTPSGRFISSKTNVLNEQTSYNWDETRSLLNSETNRLGTTNYTYDGLGQLIETKYPNGIRKSNALRWATIGNSFGAKFYSYSEASGSSPEYVWYDLLGREIRKEIFGLNGKKISSFIQYRLDEKVDKVSEPTYDATPSKWAAEYTYDIYGRPASVITPLGTTSYNYNSRITTVTSPEGTSSKVLNTSGMVQRSVSNGKGVTFTYYASGLPKTTTPDNGQSLMMEYDLQGNRTKLTDPDAGIIESTYNGFGEQLTSRQEMSAGHFVVTSNNYQPETGQLNSIVRQGLITSYGYDSNHRLESITITGKTNKTFTYGEFDRISKTTEYIDNKPFTTEVEYDAFGREKKYTYPSGYFVNSYYDIYGNLIEVKDRFFRSIWKPLEENARGQLTSISRGGKITAFSYDVRGFNSTIQSSNIVDLTYVFDSKGNLQSRIDALTNQKELFSYDTPNRLTNWDVYQGVTLAKQNSIAYNATTGNIVQKSDLDNLTMNYGENGRPHALTSITGKPTAIPFDSLNVTYTDFKKIATLTEGAKNYLLSYGVDDERLKSVYSVNGTIKQTRYYLGDYEEEMNAAGNIRKIHYLNGGAVYIQNYNKDTLLYGYSDNQGSLIALADESGNVLERYAYDPWGKRRNPSNWTQADTRTSWRLNRGYTGHEHLDAFGIINMNGRVYDPLTGMFFSPDPYVQAPDNWLNYNRYGYCYGNPLKYTDPTGEYFFYLIPNIGWDRNGGITIGLTAGLGMPGFGPSISTSYGIQSGDWSVTAGISAGGFNAYAGYGSGSGFMAGCGFNMFGLSGGFSGNMTGLGLNYSQNGGFSGNVFGMQMTQNGMSINPSLSYSLNISFSANDIDDPAKSTEKFEEIRNYNGSKLAEMNNGLLSDRLFDVHDYKNGDFGSEAQSNAPSGCKMATNGKYWNSKNYILGRASQFTIGTRKFTKMCISPFVVQSNDVDFEAYTTHELTHVVQFYNNAFYNVKNYEKAAYKATYDVYVRNGYFTSAFSAMQVAKSLGFWGSYPSIYNVTFPIKPFSLKF